jgi:hypothetical protein
MSTQTKQRGTLRDALSRIFEKDVLKGILNKFASNQSPVPDTTPWTVESIQILQDKIAVKAKDRAGSTQEFSVTRENLKLLQYVGENADNRILYAELRQGPQGVAFGPSHRIIYMGKIDRDTFDALIPELDKNGIDWVWYPIARKEAAVQLLPDPPS